MSYWTKNVEFRSPAVPLSLPQYFFCSMTVLLPSSVMEKTYRGFSMWPVRILSAAQVSTCRRFAQSSG